MQNANTPRDLSAVRDEVEVQIADAIASDVANILSARGFSPDESAAYAMVLSEKMAEVAIPTLFDQMDCAAGFAALASVA